MFFFRNVYLALAAALLVATVGARPVQTHVSDSTVTSNANTPVPLGSLARRAVELYTSNNVYRRTDAGHPQAAHHEHPQANDRHLDANQEWDAAVDAWEAVVADHKNTKVQLRLARHMLGLAEVRHGDSFDDALSHSVRKIPAHRYSTIAESIEGAKKSSDEATKSLNLAKKFHPHI